MNTQFSPEYTEVTVATGKTISVGDIVVCPDAGGDAQTIDADADRTGVQFIGVAMTNGTAGDSVRIARSGGFVFTATGTINNGTLVYSHTGPQAVTATAPAANKIIPIGRVFRFNGSDPVVDIAWGVYTQAS